MRARNGIRASLAAGLAVGLLAVVTAAAADPPVARLPAVQLDGAVHAVAISGSTAYLGGEFDSAASPGEPFQVGHFVQLDAATGTPQRSIGPFLGGGGTAWVSRIVPDGSGGWFVSGRLTIDGRFTQIGHVEPDGTLDTGWRVDIASGPLAIAVSGSTVYVGGPFTAVDGVPRRYLAALDAATGALKPFDPGLDGAVNALAVDGTTLYAGGRFTTAGNGATVRNHVAAFDTATGALTGFDPRVDPSGNVLALAVSGGKLYAGGSFVLVDGTTRRPHLAAFDLATGTATAFDPEPDQDVQALAVSGSTVYAGGFFTHAHGVARNHLAAFDAATGAPTAFDPDVGGTVTSLAVSGPTVYAGGSFATVDGGTPREALAAFSAADGRLLPGFDAHVEAAPFQEGVTDVALSGSSLFVGGAFPAVGGVRRHNLLAFDLSTGRLTDFDPDADGEVHALALAGSTLYAGGRFAHVNGTTPRRGLAAFDTATGRASAFDPNVSPDVEAIAVVGSTVFAGGDFATVNGTLAHPNLASFDAATGRENGRAPAADGPVEDFAVSGGTIYVGGGFTHLGSAARNRLGAFDPLGDVTPFDPDVDGTVDALALDGSTVYAGGSFATVDGSTARANLAAFDTAGAATAFDPKLDAAGEVAALAVSGGTLYAGGSFTAGPAIRNLAALDLAGGASTGLDAPADAFVRAVGVGGSTLVAGGNARNVPFLSVFALPAPAPPANLAPTPDFEAAQLPAWQPNGPCAAAVRSTPQAHSPGHVLELVSSTASLCRWLSTVDAIPVAPGADYDVSAWLRTVGVAATARVSANFWTAGRAYVPATVDSAPVTGTQDWTKAALHVTAPPGAAYLRVELRLNGPGTLWADDVDVHPAVAAPPPPPPPPAQNLAPDPDLEQDPAAAYYGVGAGTFSWADDAASSPTHALKLTSAQPPSSTARWLSRIGAIPVTPGSLYTVAARLKTLGVAAGNAHLTVTFWNAAQAYVPDSATDAPALAGTNDWTLQSLTTRAPAGAAYMRLEFRLAGPGTVWVDDVSVTR